MDKQEIVEKLTEALRISYKVSIYNNENDEENPGPMTGLKMIDKIIVEVVSGIISEGKGPS